jgi:hypothetical protein
MGFIGGSVQVQAESTAPDVDFRKKLRFISEMCQSGLGDFTKKWDSVIFFEKKGLRNGEDVY